MDSAVKATRRVEAADVHRLTASPSWVTAVATIVVGLFAICSRVGSCLTTFVSSRTSHRLFHPALANDARPQPSSPSSPPSPPQSSSSAVVPARSSTSLGVDGIHSSLGTCMLAVDWLAVAFPRRLLLLAHQHLLLLAALVAPQGPRHALQHPAPEQRRRVRAVRQPRLRATSRTPPRGACTSRRRTAAPAPYGPNTAYGGRGGVEMQDMGYTGAERGHTRGATLRTSRSGSSGCEAGSLIACLMSGV